MSHKHKRLYVDLWLFNPECLENVMHIEDRYLKLEILHLKIYVFISVKFTALDRGIHSRVLASGSINLKPFSFYIFIFSTITNTARAKSAPMKATSDEKLKTKKSERERVYKYLVWAPELFTCWCHPSLRYSVYR